MADILVCRFRRLSSRQHKSAGLDSRPHPTVRSARICLHRRHLVNWDINAVTYPCRRATLRPKLLFYQAPESHPKATHKPTASVLQAHHYGIAPMWMPSTWEQYRSGALALDLQHAWKALGGGLELAGVA